MEIISTLAPVASLGAILWFLYRNARPTPGTIVPETAGKPSGEPERPPAGPRENRFVRRLDYDADIAALTRRITDMELTVEQRHQQVTGLIGQLKRGDKAEQREAAREQLAGLTQEALAARKAPLNGEPQRKVLRIKRRA